MTGGFEGRAVMHVVGQWPLHKFLYGTDETAVAVIQQAEFDTNSASGMGSDSQ